MVKNYKEFTETFQPVSNPNGDPGVLFDTYLETGNATQKANIHASDNSLLWGGSGVSDPDTGYRPLYHIVGANKLFQKTRSTTPEDIIYIKLQVYVYATNVDYPRAVFAAIIEEGYWDEITNVVCWNDRIAGVEWSPKGADGTMSNKNWGRYLQNIGSGWVDVEIRGVNDMEEFDLLIHNTGEDGDEDFQEGKNVIWYTYSKNSPAAEKPRLVIKYRVWSPDAFDDSESELDIEPWEENQLYPRLFWGKISQNDTFSSFKVWRSSSNFTKPSDPGVSLLATLTNPLSTEYIDTSVLAGNQDYFYMVTVEGTSMTGDDATYSKVVTFLTPKVLTTTFSNIAINVGTIKTLAFTTNKQFLRYKIDWNDGIVSWYENDTAGTSGSITHVYYSSSGVVKRIPKVMFEDTEGFWSLEQAVADGCYVTDSTPIAFLDVGQKRVKEGNKVYLNASMSAPLASNGTITKFRFKRFVGDTWIDNGTNPILEVDTTGFSAANKTATVEITTAGGTTLAYADYTVYVEVIENFGLTRYSTINSIVESQSFNIDSGVPIGSDGETEFESLMGKQLMRISVNGKTSRGGLALDIDRIRSLYGNRTVFRITSTTFKRGTTVTWIGKIEGEPSFNHSTPNLITWDLTLKVMERIPSV